MRDNRLVLLRSSEVRFAESDGNDVWLETDQGRLRAATPAGSSDWTALSPCSTCSGVSSPTVAISSSEAVR